MSESDSINKPVISVLPAELPTTPHSRVKKKIVQDLKSRNEPLEPALPVESALNVEKREAPTLPHSLNIELVPIENIQSSKHNFRLEEAPEQLQVLAQAMQQHGFWGVLVGRRQGSLIEVAYGERRLRAAELAGLRQVPVQLRDLDDAAFFEIALQENFLCESLSPLEEALALRHMLTLGYDLTTAAQRLARPLDYLQNRLTLLKYPEVETALRNRAIEVSAAQELARIEDAPMRNKLLGQLMAGKPYSTSFVVATVDIPPRLLAAGRAAEAHTDENGRPLWKEGRKRDKSQRKTFHSFSLSQQYGRLEASVQSFVKELGHNNFKGLAKDEDWSKKTRKLLKNLKNEVSDKLEKL